MGKPFTNELLNLDATTAWAQNAPIEVLRRFVLRAQGRPLVAVGVGGSFTAAKLAAQLQEARGDIGVARTTYDFTTSRAGLREASVIIFTGGGKNRDVLGAFDFAVASEPHALLVVCATKGSLVAERASRYWDAAMFDFESPARRDGFLATNSLFATCCLLIRAFGVELGGLPGRDIETRVFSEAIEKWVHEGRSTVLALHGGWGTPAAVDLESKCSEAALTNVLLCDYRHFAHGRHLWLAKRATTSAVLAFITPSEQEIANRTLALLPREVPVLRINSKSASPSASLALLRHTFELCASFGKALGIDPGRPGVPTFGSRIYHLKPPSHCRATLASATELHSAAIERKVAVSGPGLNWSQYSQKFLARLESTAFSGIVFDFDGTLCSSSKRKEGLSPVLRTPILRLLRGNVSVGIATGRGKSARSDLQRAIPTEFWDRIIIGYYNGGQVATLSAAPPEINNGISEYVRMLEARCRAVGLDKLGAIEARPYQLTITPYDATQVSTLVSVTNVLVETEFPMMRLVQSSHSIDVLEKAASKLNVLTALQERVSTVNGAILCLGDRGCWRGNDFDLLSTSFSLSVDAVSAAPDSCWNFAPPGVRCVQATGFYLAGLKPKKEVARFSLGDSLEWHRKKLNE